MAFIVKQPVAGGKVSVHLATSVHRPGKTPCHTRQHIGMLDLQTNELILAKGRPEPDQELLELLAKKSIVYNGRRMADRRRGKAQSAPAVALESSVIVEELGRVGVLNELAEKSGMRSALRSAFCEDDADRLLWIAMSQVCEGEALYLVEDWMESVCGRPCEGMSASAATGLVREVGENAAGRKEFAKAWIRACGMPKALIHDTTSISTYSELLEDAEWGYNRDREQLPQVNLALVVAQESRIPIWYRMLPGSIPDVASLKATSSMLLDLGLRDFAFTLDRGYFSSSNLADLLDKEVHFTIGVPLHLTQSKELLKRHRRALTAFKRTFLAGGTVIGHVPCVFAQKKVDGSVANLAAHLYFNQERHGQMSARLGRIVLELAEKAAEQAFDGVHDVRRWISENAKAYGKYLAPVLVDDKFKVRVKANRVSSTARNYGTTLIVTSKEAGNDGSADREDVLADYRSRDLAEKVFDAYKNATGNGRLRTGKTDSAEGRMFVAFLAVTLRGLFENKLKQAQFKRTTNVPEALALLKKIRRITPVNGAPLLLEVPKKSREVAIAMGVEPEVMRPLNTRPARESR